MKKILITGVAGFIGFHLSRSLLVKKNKVIGIDAINNYYDVQLKKERLKILHEYKNFAFHKFYLKESRKLDNIINKHKPDVVIHLAAQAGVRYSIENPKSYVESNFVGTFNLLNSIRNLKIKHVLIASTSSVYGSNDKFPYDETQKADSQLSIYAATKKSTESLSHSYSYTFGIPITMLRFFTVYGPWGRPDMALFKFTKNIINNKPIDVFNHGNMVRDFTYIDDVVKSIGLLINKPPLKNKIRYLSKDSLSNVAKFRIINIGNSRKVKLKNFIKSIEKSLGKKAIINYLDMQIGDVPKTHSNVNLLYKLTGFRPSMSVDKGINNFIKWYKKYYKLS